LLATTQFVICGDATVTNIALPTIGADLRLSDGTLSWVTSAYVLAFGGFLLVGGRVVDLLGFARTLRVGLAIFGAASLAGSFAPDAAWLICSRAVQGLGAALLAPAGLAGVVRSFADGERRTRAISAVGAAAASSVACGQVLGGVLTAAFGWSSVLLVNVPLCLAAYVVAVRTVPPRRRRAAVRGDLDLGGALTGTGGVALLLYAVVDAPPAGQGSTSTVWLLALAVALLVAFAAIELRSSRPLLSWALLRTESVGIANAVALTSATAMFGMVFLLILYLQRTIGLSPLLAGLAFLPYGLVQLATIAVTPRAVRLFGAGTVVVAGCGLAATALVPLTVVPTHAGYRVVLPSLVLLAIGNGCFSVAIAVVGLEGVPERVAGMAGSLLTASQQLGGALGLAATAAVHGVAAAAATPLAALRWGFALDLALAAAATALAVPLARRRVACPTAGQSRASA